MEIETTSLFVEFALPSLTGFCIENLILVGHYTATQKEAQGGQFEGGRFLEEWGE